LENQEDNFSHTVNASKVQGAPNLPKGVILAKEAEEQRFYTF